MSRIPVRLLRVVILALAVATSACFSSQTVIKLRPDGSGTIEQTNLVNTAMIGMAAGMGKSIGGDRGAAGQLPKIDELFSEETLRQQGSQLGEGVRFVSSEKLTQNGMQGARAIYAFDRVEALTMGSSRARSDAASGPPTGATSPQMAFALTKTGGDLSRLTISFPDIKPDGAKATESTPATPGKAPGDIPPEALAMMRSMFDGARVGVDVEVDGRIIKTTAPASSGSRATLIEVDFGQLLSDPARFQSLQALKPGTDFETVRKALEGASGVKIPLAQTVTIDFQK